MIHPTCDNDCTMMGWIEYIINAPMYDMHVSVHPDADIDGVVTVFSHDEQKCISVNGWLWTWERLNGQY